MHSISSHWLDQHTHHLLLTAPKLCSLLNSYIQKVDSYGQRVNDSISLPKPGLLGVVSPIGYPQVLISASPNFASEWKKLVLSNREIVIRAHRMLDSSLIGSINLVDYEAVPHTCVNILTSESLVWRKLRCQPVSSSSRASVLANTMPTIV